MRLVFLNGWSASSGMLEHFKSFLPSNYELHILDDLYGFELPDIISKIEEQITSETILMGWSLGGMLALYYAYLHANTTNPKAVIVLNSPVSFLDRNDFNSGVSFEDFQRLSQIIQAKDIRGFLHLFSHLLVQASSSYKSDKRFLKQVFNADTVPSWSVLSKGLDYLETIDLREVQGFNLTHNLFIFGEKDVLVDANSNANFLEGAVNLNVKIVSGMGHFPFGFFAEDISKLIITYLSSINKSEC